MRKLFLFFMYTIHGLPGYSQSVGIGTPTPVGKLHITHPGATAHLILEQPAINEYSRLLFSNGGTSRYWGIAGRAGSGSIFNDRLSFYNTATGFESMVMAGDGFVSVPGKMSIGNAPGFGNYSFSIGNGVQGMGILQAATNTFWQSGTNISVYPASGSGYFGINTAAPSNRLQIGSIGANGFTGNDLAIGNGTQAMVIYQSAASTLLASSTDIVLRPRNNGSGKVGINTNTPRAPLDVVGYEDRLLSYTYLNSASWFNDLDYCSNCTAGISIITQRNVAAQEFNAFSDARIKSTIGVSNAGSDLEILNKLQITDYRLRDKVANGNRIYKKVIAQEVEKVFPQVVSMHTDFVPNVYQLTDKTLKTAEGYLLYFSREHTISRNAKKLRVLLAEGEAMQELDILDIPSNLQVAVKISEIKKDKIFVYGEQVNDFRTIDYEGLSALNISATQELSRLVKNQQAVIEAQNLKIAELADAIRILKEKGSGGSPELFTAEKMSN